MRHGATCTVCHMRELRTNPVGGQPAVALSYNIYSLRAGGERAREDGIGEAGVAPSGGVGCAPPHLEARLWAVRARVIYPRRDRGTTRRPKLPAEVDWWDRTRAECITITNRWI